MAIRKFVTALAVAGVLAGITGTSLEAKKRGGGGGGGNPNAAICAYLENIMAYEYVSPYILASVTSLWISYGCGGE
jgi:hypothetical protein